MVSLTFLADTGAQFSAVWRPLPIPIVEKITMAGATGEETKIMYAPTELEIEGI